MGIFKEENSYLGIDIGTAAIKIVELKKEGATARLINYGFSENTDGKLKKNWQNDIKEAAYVINRICHDSKMKSRNAVSALPTFSVFSSIINLTIANPKEMEAAVHWEAKKVIPLPLNEMSIGWQIVEPASGQNNNTKVLVTGAPKSLVAKYTDIFREAKMNLLWLETETFSLIRSLIGHDQSTSMIVEMGASTTDISIVAKAIPMLSRSLDFGGASLTEMISKKLGLNTARAEQFKYDLGVSAIDSQNGAVLSAISEAINPVVNEIKFASNLFASKNKEKVEKIILTGGSALLYNLAGYLSKTLDTKVILGDPWARVNYPADLKQALQEIGPRLSVAVGLALRPIS
jgi:type IV pilus assembly protein PilM